MEQTILRRRGILAAAVALAGISAQTTEQQVAATTITNSFVATSTTAVNFDAQGTATTGVDTASGTFGTGISGKGIGVGVQGTATAGRGGVFSGTLCAVQLVPGTLAATALTASGHTAGELYFTSDGFLCVFDGTMWRRVATESLAPPPPPPFTSTPTATPNGPTSTPRSAPPRRP